MRRQDYARIATAAAILLLAAALVAGGAFAPDRTPDEPTDDRKDGYANVIDGDTVHVVVETEYAELRLLGVDAPEISSEPNPSEWEGVENKNCLREYGLEAKQKVKGWFHERSVTVAYDPESDRQGYYDRELVYLKDDGTNLNLRLVEKGLARHYASEFSMNDTFARAEAEARSANRGAWQC